jgi:hypothetical protein
MRGLDDLDFVMRCLLAGLSRFARYKRGTSSFFPGNFSAETSLARNHALTGLDTYIGPGTQGAALGCVVFAPSALLKNLLNEISGGRQARPSDPECSPVLFRGARQAKTGMAKSIYPENCSSVK